MAAFAVDRFGGLDLVSDPSEVGAERAIDMLNVDLDRNGRLRTRDGFAVFTLSEGTNRYDSLHFWPGGSEAIIAGAGNRLEAIDVTGSVVAFSTAPTTSPHYFANFGTPTSERVYIANGTDRIRRYDSTGFTSPVGLASQTGKVIAAWGTRLVHAGGSRVSFSNAGDPETFTYSAGPPETGDFVDISPGDGESVTALATWGQYLFAFKETKFAVFTGTTEDSTGAAVFNYYMVDVGVGCTGGNAVAAAPEGLYFVAFDGVYLTTGNSPRLVSKALDPLFRQQVPAGYEGSYFLSQFVGEVKLAVRARRLYMAVQDFDGSVHNKLFVLDPDTGDWMVWGVDASAIVTTSFLSDGQSYLTFAYSTGQKHLARFLGSQTTDAGTAISWRYRSGSYDLGVPYAEKVLRDVSLWGSGTVTVQMGADLEAPDTGSSLTLGAYPAVAEGVQSIGRTGVFFSHKLSGSGQAVAHRLVLPVRATRVEGLR